jgi:selenocysteine-specific elongation factor
MELVGFARVALASAGFNLLTEAELGEKTKLSSQDIKRVMAYLREQEDLRMIKDGLLFPREMKNKLIDALGAMKEDITVASLRDHIGVSRKYTLPMLEFLDSQGLTQRIGDKRVLAGNK